MHEGADAPLEGGDALAAAKAARAYVDAVEDAQEAASRAGRPAGARRASISRSSGRRGPVCQQRNALHVTPGVGVRHTLSSAVTPSPRNRPAHSWRQRSRDMGMRRSA